MLGKANDLHLCRDEKGSTKSPDSLTPVLRLGSNALHEGACPTALQISGAGREQGGTMPVACPGMPFQLERHRSMLRMQAVWPMRGQPSTMYLLAVMLCASNVQPASWLKDALANRDKQRLWKHLTAADHVKGSTLLCTKPNMCMCI